ncbi:tyrosine-type DNA invertase [Dickeya lacustris]|uniref:Tyrosine-type DNA invertase n=2 Tax=Dickeya lacustris TaxID=2259638 RepID=A0ABY8GC87_9GAMM|nr:tyrosine-type DNA invertase [Dickeya lacustris]
MKNRRYLTREEVHSLLDAAQAGKHAARNYCMILMSFLHGYRISELLSLKISDVDMMSRQIYIRRKKNGFSSIHPLDPSEYRCLVNWLDIRKSYPPSRHSNRIFITERSGSLSRKQAWFIIKECGRKADIPIPSYPHMLRHACGYALANGGADTRLIQDYLGHRNIRHTVHYTKCNPARFAEFTHILL